MNESNQIQGEEPAVREVARQGAMRRIRILDRLGLKRALLLTVCLWAEVTPLRAELNVVTTTPDLAALVRVVGGDLVKVEALARPKEDAHFVSAKPSFIVRLNRADALVDGGAELEIGWLPTLVDQARNRNIVPGGPGRIPCNQGIEMREQPTTLDRSRGDIHAAGNPHYLIDPLNARIAAGTIAAGLSRLDPGNSARFQENFDRFSKELDAKMVEWTELFKAHQGKRIVSYHNSWSYFSARFGIRIDLFLEPKPGIPPSPAHLAKVISEMKQEKIHVIMVDPYINRRTAETAARYTEATLVNVAQFPGAIPDTEGDYLKLVDRLVKSLATALAGH